MPRPDESAFLNQILLGDIDAIKYCQIIFRASQVLDDLIDGDKVEDKAVINTFWEILIDLPKNEFYRANVDALVPMMQVFLQDWEDATNLEKEGDHEQNIAFTLRDTIGSLIIHVAHIVGGRDWGKAVALPVRKHVHEDSLKQYKEDLA